MQDVRLALRLELEARGLDVADDTVATRGGIYVKAAGDLAAGLFEFRPTAREAIETMYQGHWTPGLPPRFAVMPAEVADDPDFELLEQMHIQPLLYATEGADIDFIELAVALEKLRR